MRTVGLLNEIRMECKVTKFNLILYIISLGLWSFTFGFNFVDLFYNPIFINGIWLEISIVGIIFCSYLAIKNRKKLNTLYERELEIKISNKVKKRYI